MFPVKGLIHCGLATTHSETALSGTEMSLRLFGHSSRAPSSVVAGTWEEWEAVLRDVDEAATALGNFHFFAIYIEKSQPPDGSPFQLYSAESEWRKRTRWAGRLFVSAAVYILLSVMVHGNHFNTIVRSYVRVHSLVCRLTRRTPPGSADYLFSVLITRQPWFGQRQRGCGGGGSWRANCVKMVENFGKNAPT